VRLKAGLEIHQQLDCGKLFCKCDEFNVEDDLIFKRKLHATSSEMGNIDIAAKSEGIREFTYFNRGCNCLVYTDEEPPRGPNTKAVNIALQFAKLVNSTILEEAHFMRKIVVDGSNTSGFQRTALIAMGGQIEYEGGILELDQICLEEDSCRHGKNKDEYLLDRLGIPLLEITTKPQLNEPKQVQQAAKALGRLLRACHVKRGLGTIRQDVNVSINGGQRVELKGFQDLSNMPLVVENEIIRQSNLNNLVEGKTTQPVVVSEYFKKQKFAIACKLVGWKGLLGTKESEKNHVRMGRELADYAKKAGVNGLMHSDELPAYGISKEETNKLHEILNCQEHDAFILIFGNERMAKDAISRVIERVRTTGVPKEVRRVTPENLTRYIRPMPGASRMYPETDIPPLKLNGIQIIIPKTLDEREHTLPLNDEESKQMVSRNLDQRFKSLMKHCEDPKIVSRVLLHTLPNIATRDLPIISDKEIISVFDLVKKSQISKEGIEEALIQMVTGQEIQLGSENIEEEVKHFIELLIEEKKDFVKERGMSAIGPLMGPVMSEFRGKIDGAKINALLIDGIKKEI
jgi:glutamyl-tRNA(Gln) amidotransferase subunit E|tara:strand:+ start:11735 stop:13453 length:1719 start_codon:yes stop_codon:yes gene_type:complete